MNFKSHYKNTVYTPSYLSRRVAKLMEHFEAGDSEDDKLMAQELEFILTGILSKDDEIAALKMESQIRAVNVEFLT